jgi:hypothetical protein
VPPPKIAKNENQRRGMSKLNTIINKKNYSLIA